MVYIVVSIKVQTLDQALIDMQKAESKQPDILELRLDYMPKLNEKALDILLECAALPVIATIRYKSEAGPDPEAGFRGSEEERAAYLKQAIERGAAYVDIEGSRYESIKPYMLNQGEKRINKRKTKLIISYHDFEKTPTSMIWLYQMFVNNIASADIVKMAVQANSEDDYKRIVATIEQVNKEIERAKREIEQGKEHVKPALPFIGIGMGEHGEKTRLHPGNYLTYACLEKGEGTAVGQYTVEEMRKLVGE